MPFVHGKSTSVILGGTDVSSFLNSVDQTITRDVSESSTFGAQAKSYVKGHKDGTISLSGYWDGASGAIDSVMASALGNEVLGYGTELFPAGDAIGNYDFAGINNIVAATTPLPGFSASVQFGDNSLTRFAYKSLNVVSGVKYLFSMYVQMDDSSAPVISLTGASPADFRVDLNDQGRANTNQIFIQLISGALYRVWFIWTSNVTGSVPYNGPLKSTASSNKPFRVAGLSFRAVATVQQTRQVDTYGPELLTAGELVTDYPARSGMSQATTPISGFTNSLQFGDASALRQAFKTYASYSLGAQYLFSATVQMDDGGIPVIGTTSSSADLQLQVHGNLTYGINTGPFPSVRNITGNIYETSYRFTCTSNVSGNTGIQKLNAPNGGPNSNRTFRASGYSLRQITPVTVPTAPPLSICEAGTSTAGLRALVAQAHDTSYQVTGTSGDTVAVSCEFQVDGSFGSGAFRGVVLAPLATYSTGTNTTAVDNGSTTFGGLVANFHVLANTEWVTMKIQHSTDNSTWVDLLTNTSFSQNSSEHLVTPNVVYRYLRVNITASGSTTPRLIVTAARK